MRFLKFLAILLLFAAPVFAQNPIAPGMTPFSCFMEGVTVMTQCVVAPPAPMRIYIMSTSLSNEAATAQTLDVVYGTGANCGTTAAALTHKIQFPASLIGNFSVTGPATFPVPVGSMVCVRPTAATAFGATLTGFIAP